MSATAILANWAVMLRYDDLPPEVVAALKRAILDCVGCALAGGDARVATALLRLGSQAGGEPEATVIGSGGRASAQWAALVNGSLAHALDYDDVHEGVRGHPTAPTLPAALALGELAGASGRDLVIAYAAALEVMGRVGRVVNMAHYDRGWHASSTIGVIGAAVAGARMLRLDATQLRHALGMACSLSSGLRRNFGTDTKPLQVGAAARSGVMAAQLAAEGVDADPNIFDGARGFPAVAGEPDRALTEASLASLGQTWQGTDPGFTFKRFPSCFGTHRPINAVLELVARHELPPDQVERIECAASYSVVEKLLYPRPTNSLEARFSMPFCLAAALIDRRLGLPQFADERVNRADVQALIPKVHTTVHPDLASADRLGEEFAEVTVQLKNGRRVAERVQYPLGHPARPLTDADLDEKYLECAALRLGETGAERSLRTLRSLENVESLADLTAALVPLVAAEA